MKKLLAILICSILSLSGFSGMTLTAGAVDGVPVEVNSAADFQTISGSGEYWITADIVLADTFESLASFSGKVLGKDPQGNDVPRRITTVKPLFEELNGAEIKNLITAGTLSSDTASFGSLAKSAKNDTKIDSCINEASVTSSAGNVGGLIGNGVAAITNCVNKGNVTGGATNVGGIIGFISTAGSISGSSNEGTVTNNLVMTANGYTHTGGVVGVTYGNITDCFTTASSKVYGDNKIGGVVGTIGDGKTAVLAENLTNAGYVGLHEAAGQGNYIGGVAGQANSDLKNSKNLSTAAVEGKTNIAGIAAVLYTNYSLENCINEGTVTGTSNAAGIAASISSGTSMISGSTNRGKITADKAVGGIACVISENHTIKNCTNEGNIVSKGTHSGGIVHQNGGTITGCDNTGKVEGSTHNGGIAGMLKNASRTESCYNSGEVLSSATYAGGIAGQLDESATEIKDVILTNCGNAGKVSATSHAAGIIGRPFTGLELSKCYNTGAVEATLSGSAYAGGITGWYKGGSISDCYSAGTFAAGPSTTDLRTGGIIGYTETAVNLTRCYSIYSPIPGATRQRALCYPKTSGLLTAVDCYFAEGLTTTDGAGTALTTEQMKSIASFNNFAANGWVEGNALYPYPQLSSNMQQLENPFAGGNGTQSDPFRIETAEQFNAIARYPSAVYKQTAEFTLTAPVDSFSGIYDGDNKIITLNINNTDESILVLGGLFKQVTGDAVLRNIHTKGSITTTSTEAGTGDEQNTTGGIIGFLNSITAIVENCVNEASINAQYKIGGIIGRTINKEGAQLNRLINFGSLAGSQRMGGIIGLCYTPVTNCANYGSVSSSSTNVGGIVGQAYCSISNSFNSGDIVGSGNVGGISGTQRFTSNIIENCYNTGNITAKTNDYAGGITSGCSTFSDKPQLTLTNCYNLGKIQCKNSEPFNPLFSFPGGDTSTPTVISTPIITNCYYLSPNGQNDGWDGTTAKNMAEMKILADDLGDAFEAPSSSYLFPELKGNPNESGYQLFVVSVTAGSGGTVNPLGDNYIRRGDTFTVSLLPDDAYMIGKILYDGNEVSATTEGVYTTPAIEKDVTISISFSDKPITPPSVAPFQQVYIPAEKNGNITFGTITLGYGTTIKEWGIVYSATQSHPEIGVGDAQTLKAEGKAHPLNSKNQYGIELKGTVLAGTSYYTRPYVIYTDSAGDHIQYGDPVLVDLR